jgi:hypothetical protein
MNRKVPGVGSYNVENVHKIVTSGLAKGWKWFLTLHIIKS